MWAPMVTRWPRASISWTQSSQEVAGWLAARLSRLSKRYIRISAGEITEYTY